jgi:hypothetical protein
MVTGQAALRSESSAAKVAMIALACNGLLYLGWFVWWVTVSVRVAGGPPSEIEAAAMNALVNAVSVCSVVALLVGGVCFFVWISRAFRCARALRVPPSRYDATSAIVGFFIPFLNLVRPYQALRDLDAAIEPTRVPEPPPRPASGDDGRGYREAASAPRPTYDVRKPPLLAWWVAWLGQLVLGIAASAASASWSAAATAYTLDCFAEALAAALAIAVVRQIDARLHERAARVLHSTTG